MDNSKEIEQDREKTAADADTDAMVIDNNAEVEKETAAGEEEKGLSDDLRNQSMEVENEKPVEDKNEGLGSSEKQSMEIENERPVEAKDEELAQCKEKETVGTKLDNNGELDSNKSVTDVPNRSVEEKGSVETPPANESTCGKILVPENQPGDSARVEEKDEKPEEVSNAATGMELSSQDRAKKEESSNGLVPEQLFIRNGAKEEDSKNEVERVKAEDPKRGVTGGQSVVCDGTKGEPAAQVKEKLLKPEQDRAREADVKTPTKSFLYDTDADGYESGTEEEQAAFIKELEVFHRERGLDFKPPKFYQEKLNLLKLWRSVIKLGGYEQVTSCKLWRQVGESFKPPKTCTTVSWTFRGFYEKSLLEYEKHKILSGELPEIDASLSGSMSAGTQVGLSQASGSGRTRRDAAARAMQGWHSMRLLSNGEVGDPIIKDKNSISLGKREKQLKSIGLLKRRKESPIEQAAKVGHLKSSKPQSETMVVDIGPPADWVKINVQRTKDCFEVYALVPGLLREEVRVQSDPAGRLVISGQPEQLDNPWGVTPFKKVVTLPSRIDPHQTSAVVTLHGQLFVRVPFEQSDT